MPVTKVITTKGLALNAKIQAGTGDVKLPLIEVVADAGRSDDLLNLENSVDPRMNFVFEKKTATGVHARIRVMLTNLGNPFAVPPIPQLATAFSMNMINFFATDPDEGRILYQVYRFDIDPSTGSGIPYVPSAAERPWVYTPEFIITISDAGLLTIEIDMNSLASRQSILDAIEEHNLDPDAHEDIRAQLAALIGHAIAGIVNTVSDLPPPASLPPGTVLLVRADENHGGVSTLYEVRETGEWAFIGTLGGAGGQAANTPITTIPITSADAFGVWQLYKNAGGIFAPLENWGFTNALLTTIPSRIEADLNTNTAQIFATSEFAGQTWTSTQQHPGVWLIAAQGNPSMSLILVRR